MQGHIDLVAIVLLSLAGVAIYIAYRNPRLGAAILVGIGVIGLLVLLLGSQQPSSTTAQQHAPTCPAASQAVNRSAGIVPSRITQGLEQARRGSESGTGRALA
jgi:multisubunit Na+/H+ antiporter MnhB subunit